MESSFNDEGNETFWEAVKEDPKADNCITDGQAATSNNDVLPDNEQCQYSTVIEPPETLDTVMVEGTQVPPETLDTVMDKGTKVLEEMSRPVQERSEFTEEVPCHVEEAFEVSDMLPSSVDRPALPMDLVRPPNHSEVRAVRGRG
jgi:hypothetical protein